jgi:hypothetical protein
VIADEDPMKIRHRGPLAAAVAALADASSAHADGFVQPADLQDLAGMGPTSGAVAG